MRSSKSRSRSKTSRPRTLGNIINRVFDSSGPEGKVRGTPAQLIEKYQFLARDAQLSNDRVAAENFLQHAEHYTRLLAEANREMAAEQESRQQYQQNNNQNSGQQNTQNQQRDRQQGDRDQRNEQRNDQRNDRREDRSDFRPEYRDVAADEQPIITAHDLVDHVRYDDAGLVETPEAAPRPVRPEEQRRPDRPRYDRPRDEQRRSYPPRVDQNQADRSEKPVEVRATEPVVAAPAPAPVPAPVPKPKPAPKPAQPPAAAKPLVVEGAVAPKPRTRAPRKPAENGAKAEAPASVKAAEE
jgi:hypothetical protein